MTRTTAAAWSRCPAASAAPSSRSALSRVLPRRANCSWSPTPATTSSISGLSISPDIDTLIYTLAGLDDPETRLGPARRDLELHGGARARSAARPGFSSATATSPCMSSARGASPRARRCPRSPPTSAGGSASRPRIVPMTRRPRAHARAHRRRAGSTSRTISCASSASRRCASLRYDGATSPRRTPACVRRALPIRRCAR